ncbi:metal-dependent hydrolase family protein [Bifidobacterium olomucense]|uniref:Imidazolonepropionase n=1 Tax=Bifidobacterium olomucense TaxID=2675324 RepID=A0A7Y0EX44_9BIFI|nr:amidohydrolase family protein [Bifidobacterium sp. DSM 109959]NMM98031.1 imidazolonepropionase [Bifidobacterium sp. DSM 109959]
MKFSRKYQYNPIVEPFALSHVHVVMADAAGSVRNNMTILVGANGRIEQIAPSIETSIPEEYHYLDGTGKTVMPGLINLHTHLFAQGKPLNPRLATPQGQRMVSKFVHSPLGKPYLDTLVKTNAMTLLESGVTTIRTLGDVGYEVTALRDRVNAGEMPGPRILSSGPLLAIPEGHGAPLIALTSATPQEARATAAANIAHGVNVIKIAATGGVTDAQKTGEAGSPQMSVEQMRAICDEAHAHGIIVAAHAQSPEGVRRALTAGVDTIEHGSTLDDELIALFRHNPNSLRGYSALVPTLSAGLPLTMIGQDITGITDIQLENSKHVVAGMVAGAKQAHEAGLVIGVGTDTGMTFVPQYATWRELELLVRFAGFTPQEAIHAVTQVNARVLGVDGITGSLEVGKFADFVVLNDDPYRNLHTLNHPVWVVAAGHPVWRPSPQHFPEIDTLLDEAYD